MTDGFQVHRDWKAAKLCLLIRRKGSQAKEARGVARTRRNRTYLIGTKGAYAVAGRREDRFSARHLRNRFDRTFDAARCVNETGNLVNQGRCGIDRSGLGHHLYNVRDASSVIRCTFNGVVFGRKRVFMNYHVVGHVSIPNFRGVRRFTLIARQARGERRTSERQLSNSPLFRFEGGAM